VRHLIEELRGLVEVEVPFQVGDIVKYGKYKNKSARVVVFGVNHKGQATIEVEPVPKGRKKNKILGLYKVWTMPASVPEPDLELESVQKLREFGPPDGWSGGVAAVLGPDRRKELQRTWDQLSASEKEAVRKDFEANMEAAPVRTRRRKAGSGQRHMSRQCPAGMNMTGGRCVRVQAGKRAKLRRQKKKWGRTGAATKSKKKSKRLTRRFSSLDRVGALIAEARSLLDNS